MEMVIGERRVHTLDCMDVHDQELMRDIKIKRRIGWETLEINGKQVLNNDLPPRAREHRCLHACLQLTIIAFN